MVSFAIDTNVLLYASDTGSRFHDQARSFLFRCINGEDVFYIGWPTLMSYLRIATHLSVFASPLAPEEAKQNIETLLELPHVRVLAEEEGFWNIYRQVTARVATRGNLVPDAHLAALLRQHGVRRLYTNDRDFLKFDFLQVKNPFA